MIVHTMTYEEIVKEINIDFKINIEPRLQDYFGQYNKYRRFMIKDKTSKTIYFQPIYYTSNRGNKYVIRFVSDGKSQFLKNGILYYIYVYYYQSNGIYSVMLSNETYNCKKLFLFYTPHFFDRYKERHLKDSKTQKLYVIEHFFSHNKNNSIQYLEDKFYENSLFITTEEGVCFGDQISQTIIEVKTYISFEMLRRDQLKIQLDGNTMIREFIEKYYLKLPNKLAKPKKYF